MLGPLLALFSASLLGMNKIFLRRAVLKISNASLGTLISVPMAVPLIWGVLLFTGQTQTLLNFSPQGYLWLSVAGILHFVVGRSFNYKCVKLVGANITNLICRCNILVSVIIGTSLLKEPVSWQLAAGVFFIIVGISLPGLSQQLLHNSSTRLIKIPGKAFIFGIACGLAWGISPIFIKLGLKGSGSPVAGAFISFLAASAVLFISMTSTGRRASISKMSGRAAFLFFSAGLLSFIANMGRFVALGLAPASVVTPLFSTSPVFVLIFSFLFNRNLEIFSKPVVAGTAMVLVGSILLI